MAAGSRDIKMAAPMKSCLKGSISGDVVEATLSAKDCKDGNTSGMLCFSCRRVTLVDSSFNQTALSLLEDLVSFRRMYESLNAKALGNRKGVPAGHRKVQVRSVAPSSGFLSRRHDDDICLAVIGRICHAANRRLGMHYKKLGDYHRAPGSRDEFERTSESSR